MALTAQLRALLRAAQRTHWAALILIVAAWLFYRPSLNYVFVADQILYIAELGGSYSLADGLQHYDYAATRRYWKGDDALFRPLLFAWLAVNSALFSYHHVWWNLANLGLHAMVALLLHRLLVAIHPSPFALLTALLFVVLKPQVELVVWNHLGGYLLACLFFLIGLRRFVRLTDPIASATGRDAAVYAAAFTLACLCHEAMVPISLLGASLASLHAWRAGRRPTIAQLLLLFSPVLTFAVLYVIHVLRVQRLTYVARADPLALSDAARLLQAVPVIAIAVGRWAMDLAFPAAVELLPWKLTTFSKEFAFDWSSPLDLFNVVLFAVILLLLARAMTISRLRRNLTLVVLLAGGIVAYAGVICLGRPAEVARTSYYLYFFDLMAIILVYSLIDFDRVRGGLAVASAVAVSSFLALHASGTLEVTRKVGRINEGPSRYLTRISRFVDRHRAEPDFSFAIPIPERTLDPNIVLREGYPDDPKAEVRVRRMTQILFERYYSEQQPKYLFDREMDSR